MALSAVSSGAQAQPLVPGIAVPTGLRELVGQASTRRFRSANRARLRWSARASMILAAAAGTANCAWLMPDLALGAGRVVAANGLVVASALITFLALGRTRRLAPEVAIFGMLVVVDVAAAMAVGVSPSTSLLAAGYALLLPPVVALLIPWSPALHLLWLATHGIATVVLSALSATHLAPDNPRTLLTLLIVASAASVAGHLMNLRARVTSFVLLEQVRSMNRAARRSEGTLRELNSRLEHAAWTDGLTGFGNRHALQGQLAGIRGRIKRNGDRFALLMLDLDHFKAINDTQGHFAGDDVLRRVAAAIGGAMRAGDMLYRFGGEEFLAVVQVAGVDDAWLAGDRVRRAIERLRLDHAANRPFGVVTASIGVAVIGPPDADADEDDWLKRSDEALYLAKAEGRNRVVVFGGSETP